MVERIVAIAANCGRRKRCLPKLTAASGNSDLRLPATSSYTLVHSTQGEEKSAF